MGFLPIVRLSRSCFKETIFPHTYDYKMCNINYLKPWKALDEYYQDKQTTMKLRRTNTKPSSTVADKRVK